MSIYPVVYSLTEGDNTPYLLGYFGTQKEAEEDLADMESPGCNLGFWNRFEILWAIEQDPNGGWEPLEEVARNLDAFDKAFEQEKAKACKLWLFLLQQEEEVGYDTYDSMIVAAHSPYEAKKLSIEYANDQKGPKTWASSPKVISYCKIGKAIGYQCPMVVLGSFNAG